MQASKFEIIKQQMFYCIWGNSQAFGNFEKPLSQGKPFDIKLYV